MKLAALAPLLVLALSAPAQTTLYEQPHDGGGTIDHSSWWDPDGSDWDQIVWDAFTLPANSSIATIAWRGGYDPTYFGSGGPAVDFSVAIYNTIPAGIQPDVVHPPLVKYMANGNANETPAGTFGGVAMYDYHIDLAIPFEAAANTRYWVQIVAWQHGVPDWSLARATGGDGGHFRRIAGIGDYTFQSVSGDTAFRVAGTPMPAMAPFEVLHSMAMNEPAGPATPLFKATDGRLYGGASAAMPSSVFRVSNTGKQTTVKTFAGDLVSSVAQDAMDDLYVTFTTSQTIVRMTLAGQVVWSIPLTIGPSGRPLAPVMQHSDGWVYGTTSTLAVPGALPSEGDAIYRFIASGQIFQGLHAFTGADGWGPVGALVSGGDGWLYGVTRYGGAAYVDGGATGFGTVFRVDPRNAYGAVFESLHSFEGTDGAFPAGGLVKGADGFFYGMTEGRDEASGVSVNGGTIYRVDAAGKVTVLHTFDAAASGDEPVFPAGALALGPEGLLYGVTSTGRGAFTGGTVFRTNSAGAVTLLHAFALDGSEGLHPAAGPAIGSDGALYGTATVGGASARGTLWRVDRASFLMPGDVNGDARCDVADVFYLINALFAAGPKPTGLADANGDGSVDVADVFYLINYLFAGGSPPH